METAYRPDCPYKKSVYMKRYDFKIILAIVVAQLGASGQSLAQVVAVTAQLDTNIITVGQSTILRIYAQVSPAYRAEAERIFSWYVDVLNTNSLAASADYASMLKPESDKDPLISSNGFTSGTSRLGVYDTFLNHPGAGVTNPVELLSIPVTGLTVGKTRFGVRHGTGVASLSEDFLVAPTGAGEFISGGVYSAAFANLTVVAAPSNSINCLTLTHTNLPDGSNRVMVQFCPQAGYNHYVEYRDQLVGGPGWQPFPNGPHNSGIFIETNSVPLRFYRVRGIPVSGLAPFQLDIIQINRTQMRLSYPITPGFNYSIEFRTNLVSGTWQTWPGSPHNSGEMIVTNNSVQLFFRVGASPQ